MFQCDTPHNPEPGSLRRDGGDGDHYKFVMEKRFLNAGKGAISNFVSISGRVLRPAESEKLPVFRQKTLYNRLRVRYLDRLFFKGKLP